VDVALGGRRRWSVSQRLGPRTYLFAVAHAVAARDSIALESDVLNALCEELELRAVGRRVAAGGLRRPKAVSALLLSALTSVNYRVRAKYGVDDDVPPAAASLSAVLVVRTVAVVAHVGTTGTYVHRMGELAVLTEDDVFDEAGGAPVLTRAIGLQPQLEVRTLTTELHPGDILVLCGHRLRRDADRTRIGARLALLPDEMRIEQDALFVPFDALREEEFNAGIPAHPARRALAAILATLLIYAALCIR